MVGSGGRSVASRVAGGVPSPTFSRVDATALLRYVRHIYQDKLHSLLLCIDVVDVLQSMKACTVSADVLERAIFSHLHKFKAVWGKDATRFKHHAAGHLAFHYRKYGKLPSCFVHERHHRLLNHWLRPRHNTKSWELGLIEEALHIVCISIVSGFVRCACTLPCSRLIARPELADYRELKCRPPPHSPSVEIYIVSRSPSSSWI